MGNTAHCTVLGDVRLVDFARTRLSELESMWSRFLPTSEISRLNTAGGARVTVSPETVRLVQYMIGGWRATSGMFDPSMLGELVRDGYAQSRACSAITVLPSGIEWVKDLGAVSIEGDTITLPAGMHLDPGGIGKGLAADMVATELLERGATGAFVSVGGDIRCVGEGDCDGVWVVDIEHPFEDAPIASVELSSGAVATSSIGAKTFLSRPEGASSSGADIVRSHIMDPRTRRTLETGQREIVQSTILAAECVWAEVFSKAMLVLDDPRRIEFASNHGLAAMCVDADGSMSWSTRWKDYVR